MALLQCVYTEHRPIAAAVLTQLMTLTRLDGIYYQQPDVTCDDDQNWERAGPGSAIENNRLGQSLNKPYLYSPGQIWLEQAGSGRRKSASSQL
jgi:hypothetical protein